MRKLFLFLLLASSTRSAYSAAIKQTYTSTNHLTYACLAKTPQTVESLLLSKADANPEPLETETAFPLFAALCRSPFLDQQEVIRLLLNHQADANRRIKVENNHVSLLIIAAHSLNRGALVQLIDAKADISYKDSNGYSALDYAHKAVTEGTKTMSLLIPRPPAREKAIAISLEKVKPRFLLG